MENNINAFCGICGQGYHRCDSCNNSEFKPWRSIVDNVEHYKIYMIISDYENGYLTKGEAKEQLSQRDLTGLETFVPEIKAKINEIMAVEIKVISKSKSKKNLNSIDMSDESTL